MILIVETNYLGHRSEYLDLITEHCIKNKLEVTFLIHPKYLETRKHLNDYPFLKFVSYESKETKVDIYKELIYIKKYDLIDNINFIGRLNENEIIDYLLKSDVYINPSFVESYSAASAEALYLGVPSVLSYAGAMPDFSNQKEVALYYSPMDFVDLASKISILIEDNELSNRLSKNSIQVLEEISNRETIKNIQLSIYSHILNNVCNNNN